ncbi:MAG: reverse transcriptase-like protein [Acidimicrobiia bacterium]|nr:reverse transcriptase-like protein [Acidimicrobiia bacterium]
MTDYIIEADGGSRGNPGPAAYGTVIMNAGSGEVVAELGEFIGVATNNVAEYRGLVAALEYLAEHDPEASVVARLDSKLVVEQMSGRWKIKHPGMKELSLRARRAFPPNQVSYEWVPRHRNKAADAIVNRCLDRAASESLS